MAVPLIGREADLDALDRAVEQALVVTVVGPGGVGKTRLVTEWARRREPAAQAALVVCLAGEADDAGAVDRVASRLGFGSFDALRLGTAAGPTLVVVDNCESAPTTARSIAAGLAGAGGTTQVVATSRQALGVPGELVRVLAPLAVPPPGPLAEPGTAAAVELFLGLAEAAGAPWPLDAATLADVAELVRCLDGLPLAIELAAARMRALSPGDLLALLDRRLDLLARPAGAEDERHGSLRAAIATSYELLPGDQRALFRALATFPAPADLDLVRRVAAPPGTDVVAVVDLVGELVDRSLVVAEAAGGGATRYRLYDSLRAYAHERLAEAGEADALRERYVEEMAAAADEFVAQSLKRWEPERVRAIVERFPHLLAAVEHALGDATAARAYRLVVPLYGPAHGAAAAAVAALVRRVLDRWDGRGTPLRAEVLAVGASAMLLAGDLDGAFAHAHEAVAEPDATPLALMVAHRTLGYVGAHRGDRARGRVHLDAALALVAGFEGFRRELQVSWVAIVDHGERDDEALALVDAVADEAAADGDVVNQAWAHVVAANRRLVRGELAGAERDAGAVLALAQRQALSYFASAGHRSQALVLALGGRWDESVAHWRAALEGTVSTGDTEGLTLTVRLAAAAAARCGDEALADGLWALATPGRGRSVMPSPLAAEEARLGARARPLPAPGPDDAFRRAIALLAPPAPPPAPVAGGAAAGAGGTARERGRILVFGACELDVGRHELRRDGAVVPVEPQVFDVLVTLADRTGQLVTKHELLDEVWGDRFVSDSAVTSRIRAARRAVGDDGRAQQVIRTVHGRGYLFVPPVRTR